MKTKKVNIESKASLSLEAIFKHYFPNKTYQGKFTYCKNKIKNKTQRTKTLTKTYCCTNKYAAGSITILLLQLLKNFMAKKI